MPPNEGPSYHSPNESATPISGARAWVALGSNLGDRRATLERALVWLGSLPGTTLEAASPFYRTAALTLNGAASPDFINAVVRLRTTLAPLVLLAALWSLEHAAGRKRTIVWGPRTLDLDLLLYEDRVVHDRALTLPHPRMHERAFVLAPLAALDPELVHPTTGHTIAWHLQRASDITPELL